MIDDQNFIDQSVKWHKKVQEHQNDFYRNEDDCRTSCLLDHSYFKRIAKMLCKSILVLVQNDSIQHGKQNIIRFQAE